MKDEFKNHTKAPDGDGYICDQTGERTNYVFWDGTQPFIADRHDDLCPHCSDWTPGSKLQEINDRRALEAQPQSEGG